MYIENLENTEKIENKSYFLIQFLKLLDSIQYFEKHTEKKKPDLQDYIVYMCITVYVVI